MGDKINKEVLRGNSDVDEYIVFEKKFFKLLKMIRSFGFDFGCVLTPDSYSFALLFLGGVKAITLPEIKNGFSPWETRTYKIMRRNGILTPHFMGSYAPREYLRLLEPIGIFTDDTKKYLAFSDEADKKTTVFLKKKEFHQSPILSLEFLRRRAIKSKNGRKRILQKSRIICIRNTKPKLLLSEDRMIKKKRKK